MTNEELVRCQAGERERLAALWEQVQRFVMRQAGKYVRAWHGYGGATMDDLMQSGFLALLDAADSYDATREMSFIGWLALRLKTGFAEAGGWRSSKRDPLDGALSLDTPLASGDTLQDVLEDPNGVQGFEDVEARAWHEELHTALERALCGLPEAERDAIRRRYYQGKAVDRKVHTAALRALRHPSVSRGLYALWRG